jgi:SAM-dependent methyltransferase
MNLEYLKENWISDINIEVMRELWDNSAGDYYKKPVPEIEKDNFLCYVKENGGIDKEYTTLDIGCGSGVYSLALAPYVKKAAGCDLSPKMIETANIRAKEENITNAEFVAVDWYACDIKEYGWEKAFDVVFAHMTPAVGDYDSLEKMLLCAKKKCFIQKNTRREDLIQDKIFGKLGVPVKKENDPLISNAFTYLWLNGYEPKITFHKEVWNADRAYEDAVKWYINRARQRADISANDEDKIKEYLNVFVDGGIVREVMSSTIVSMYWNM